MCVDKLKLLFFIVYYEGNDDRTVDFIDFVEKLINNNLDCHMIVDRDLMVTTRNRLHIH